MGITYDTGALLAAEANRTDMWALHRDALGHQVRPIVPAPVLAQAWRGGPQHNLSRLLRGCDVVDAAVVVLALARDDLVVTSDEDDLQHLASALGQRLKTHRI